MLSQSEQIDELAAALAKAQGEFKPPAMSATARITGDRANYTFKYAPLEEGINATREALSKNGIAFTQRPFEDRSDGRRYMLLETRLSHGNQWLAMTYPVADIAAIFGNEKFDPKKLGALITYARRYSLFAILGIAGEEDVEGDGLDAAASGNGKGKAAQSKPLTGQDATKLKEQLLDDIARLNSLNDCLIWARDARAIKARLPQADQTEVEGAFTKRQEDLRD